MTTEETILNVTSQLKKGFTARPHYKLLFRAYLALWLPVLLYLPFPPLRLLLGLLVVFFAPGNALMKALFPVDGKHNGIERVALSFGLSVAILPILALLLSELPWGIKPVPVALSLSIWIAIFYCIAAVRRLKIEAPDEESGASRIRLKDWWRSLNNSPHRTPFFGLITLLYLLIVASLALFVIFYLPFQTRPFTEFYILGADGLAENYPSQSLPIEQNLITVGITNHEGAEVQYRVEFVSGTHSFAQIGPISLKNGETWEKKLNIALPESVNNQPVDILLFHNDNSTPYRRLQLWMNSP